MTTLWFLGEWALRSSLVVVTAALLLKLLRVKDPSLRWAVWTTALLGSLLLPSLSRTLPGLRVPAPPAAVRTLMPLPSAAGAPIPAARFQARTGGPPRVTGANAFRPAWILLPLYFSGMAVLLLRLLTGLMLSRRLVRRSQPTGRFQANESFDLNAPATFGILRPVVLLPRDWREWEDSKLEAVLAHERSHIRRHDPAVQMLSAIHRALFWYSPLSWFLHRQIVRTAEDASDDAALAKAQDRVSYAEVLLEFVGRTVGPVRWQGVAMARYGKADDRIQRILDGTCISRGLTRAGWLGVLALAAPFVYVAAAAHPAAMLTPQVAFEYQPSSGADVTTTTASAEPDVPESSPEEPPDPPQGGPIRRYLIFSGNSTSGSYDSRDHLPIEQWRSRYGPEFVWFRQDGRDYLVTDEQVMEDLHNAMAPQREVNRMQAEVNGHEADVNRMQMKVNNHQNEINRQQAAVNRQQQEVNERQRDGYTDHAGQSRVNALQADVNDQQKVVNQEQSRVNGEQAIVNGEQEKVNAEQHRINPLVESAVQAILESTIPKGLAHRIPR